MNRIYFLLFWFAFSCGNSSLPEDEKTKNAEVYYPYSPRLDVDFENGNKNYANIILNIWRGYSSGNVRDYRKYFSDSIRFIFNDKIIEGRRDSVINIYQERRNRLSTVQAHIDYWQPVFEKEKKQHWVLLWVTHEGSLPDKKMDSYSIHQVWKFNSTGKIYLMQEYRSSWNW